MNRKHFFTCSLFFLISFLIPVITPVLAMANFTQDHRLYPDVDRFRTHSFPVEQWSHVYVEIEKGSIDVFGHAQDYVEIIVSNKKTNPRLSSNTPCSYHIRYQKLHPEKQAPMLSLNARCPQSNVNLQLTIRLPFRQLTATFYTHFGNISSYSVNALELGLHTLRGKIIANHHRGALHLENKNGPIYGSIYEIGHELMADANFGNIELSLFDPSKLAQDLKFLALTRDGDIDLKECWDDFCEEFEDQNDVPTGSVFSNMKRRCAIRGLGERSIVLKAYQGDIIIK